jgi:hypothetical protein
VHKRVISLVTSGARTPNRERGGVFLNFSRHRPPVRVGQHSSFIAFLFHRCPALLISPAQGLCPTLPHYPLGRGFHHYREEHKDRKSYQFNPQTPLRRLRLYWA